MLVLNRNMFFNRTGECLKKAKICRLRPTTATDDKIMSNFAKCILFKVLRHLNTESNANNVSDCANKVFFLEICFNCMSTSVASRTLMERKNVATVAFIRKTNIQKLVSVYHEIFLQYRLNEDLHPI